MSVELARVAEIRARRADGDDAVGSGILIYDDLLLTARHVVEEADGTPRGDIVARRAPRHDDWTETEVAWRGQGAVDAALLRVTRSSWPLTGGPTRWGRICGQQADVACETVGFPDALKDDDTGKRVPEHADGHVNPGTAFGERYDVSLDSSVPAPGTWAGMSGAGLFADEFLVGVVVIDTPRFDGQRLTAVPVAQITGDEGFREALGDVQEIALEAVELAGLFAAPSPPVEELSVATALRADIEAVRFRGRGPILADLMEWCRSDPRFSAKLIIGPGGQGKTRLGRQLAHDLRSEGWVAGFIAEQGSREAAERLRDVAVPVLLIADYAEARSDQILFITQLIAARAGSTPIRLLLLARSDGAWWDQLRTDARYLDSTLTEPAVTSLTPLAATTEERVASYEDALSDLADILVTIDRTVDWPELVEPARRDRELDAGSWSALELQMAALADLLQASPNAVAEPSGRVEDVLLRHEQRYWQRTAKAHGLPYQVVTLRAAVMAATLCGAASEEEALDTVARLPGIRDDQEERRYAAATWLRDLYPPPEGGFWGGLQPDRLGEHLVATTARARPGLLGDVLPGATDRQRLLGLTVLARAAAHEPDIPDILRPLFGSHLRELAIHAIFVAVQAADPQALLEPLEASVGSSDDADALLSVASAFPRRSATLINFAALTTERLVELLRAKDPVNTQLLARALLSLSMRYGMQEQVEKALDAAAEAVGLLRAISGEDPELRGALYSALNNFANGLSAGGRSEEAVAAAQEAADGYERLYRADAKEEWLSLWARAVGTLSNCYTRAGDAPRALEADEAAVALHRQLVQSSRTEEHLADLAHTVRNLAVDYTQAGRDEDALESDYEAVNINLELIQMNADAHLFEFAESLSSVGSDLLRLDRLEDALGFRERAATAYFHLADRSPAYLPRALKEARALSALFSELGRHAEALVVDRSIESVFRELAERFPEARPGHARALEAIAADFLGLNDLPAALSTLEAAAAAHRSILGDDGGADPAYLARLLRKRADVLDQLDRPDEAASSRREADELSPEPDA